MRFLLPEAPVMLRFLQRKQRARAQLATLTQKADNDKHKEMRQKPEQTINNYRFKKRIITP
jgi:hypothetical protein